MRIRGKLVEKEIGWGKGTVELTPQELASQLTAQEIADLAKYQSKAYPKG